MAKSNGPPRDDNPVSTETEFVWTPEGKRSWLVLMPHGDKTTGFSVHSLSLSLSLSSRSLSLILYTTHASEASENEYMFFIPPILPLRFSLFSLFLLLFFSLQSRSGGDPGLHQGWLYVK